MKAKKVGLIALVIALLGLIWWLIGFEFIILDPDATYPYPAEEDIEFFVRMGDMMFLTIQTFVAVLGTFLLCLLAYFLICKFSKPEKKETIVEEKPEVPSLKMQEYEDFFDNMSSILKSQEFSFCRSSAIEIWENANAKFGRVLEAGFGNIGLNVRKDEINKALDIMVKYPSVAAKHKESVLAFIVRERIATFPQVDKILQSEDFTEALKKSPNDVSGLLRAIMVKKVEHSCDSFTYDTNYRIFMDWMPKMRKFYPEVWDGVASRLLTMGGISSICREEIELYNLYNPQ